MSLLHRVGLLLAGAIVSSALVALPVAPAHADYDLTVTWPDAEELNPDAGTYQITISDTGPGDLFLEGSLVASQAIPHNGTVTVNLPNDGAGFLEIWRCADFSCSFTGVYSPFLRVQRQVAGQLYDATRATSPGIATAKFWSYSYGSAPLTYEWALGDGDGGTLDSGAGSSTSGAVQDLSITVPSGLPDGQYPLTAQAHTTFAGLPMSSPVFTTDVIVDNSAPVLTPSVGESLFFPAVDSYRDRLDITVGTDEPAELRYDLLAADGTLIRPMFGYNFGMPGSWSWNGKVGGDPVDAGTYRIGVTGRDELGHESAMAMTEPFQVDLARRKTVKTETQLAPSKVIYSKYVGKCSSLVSPSSHRWKKSLGYYSQTKCKSVKNNASVVLVWHATWLPTSMHGLKSFDLVNVDAYGGAARKARSAYLVGGYIDNKGSFFNRSQFTSSMRWHSIKAVHRQVDLTRWVRYQDGRPYIVWSAGLTEGSRYDVKVYRLRATFEALVEPDGSIIAAPGKAAFTSVAAARKALAKHGAPDGAPHKSGVAVSPNRSVRAGGAHEDRP